ncbi:endothelin-converting enzyme 1 [Patella vulgata]|uniref:endothelin-converting enzyme 1 n=1 Tax=Patella vulgata TaxID=6465 RepID=UPI0021800D2E|nr:endothelin-converting enzyme 1 [Patella vulgata]
MAKLSGGKYSAVYSLSMDSYPELTDGCLTHEDDHEGTSGKESPVSLPQQVGWLDDGEFDRPRLKGHNDSRVKCMCCIIWILFLSTTGLATLLGLVYTGVVHFTSYRNATASRITTAHSIYPNGTDIYSSDRKLQVCKTPECIETAASILGRMVPNADPCQDFNRFACGGFATKASLSWHRTRLKENPEQILDSYASYLIDVLSESYLPTDNLITSNFKTLFRSCLLDTELGTRKAFLDIVDDLGGVFLSSIQKDTDFDLTTLLANVTRLYGASPFFKIIIHGGGKFSVVNRFSDRLVNLLRDSSDDIPNFRFLLPSEYYYRTEKVETLQTQKINLLRRLVAEVPQSASSSIDKVLDEVFSFEDELHMILYDDESAYLNEDFWDCSQRRTDILSKMDLQFSGYQLNWTVFFNNVFQGEHMTLCNVQLNTAVQTLLQNTPKHVLKRYTILHTVFNTDLLVLFPSILKQLTPKQEHNLLIEGFDHQLERQCVGYVFKFIPGSLHCTINNTKRYEGGRKFSSVFDTIRATLSDQIVKLFDIDIKDSQPIINRCSEDVGQIWNQTVNQDSSIPSGFFTDQSFTINIINLITHQNIQYLHGHKKPSVNPLNVASVAQFVGCLYGRGVSGPISYPLSLPINVHFGSMGSFLARQMTEKLDLDVVLNHYGQDLLDHSAVLNLALKLQCLASVYSNFQLLTEGTQTYKVRGDHIKNESWKDHLSLKLTYEAWLRYNNGKRDVITIPGLPYNQNQLFFVLFAQTMCEKVNKRGILDHYIQDSSNPLPPSKYRINGAVMNFAPFARAFQCPADSPMNPRRKCPTV